MVSKKIFPLLAAILMNVFAVAQNAAHDIRNINTSLLADNLAVTLHYAVYPDSISKKSLQSEEGKWIRSKTLQYYSLGSLETIRKAGDVQLVIDHTNKLAVISNAPVLPEDGSLLPGSIDFETILEGSISNRYKSVDKTTGRWDIYPMASDFQRISVSFDKKSFFPKKMVLYYAGEQTFDNDEVAVAIVPRIEIEFKSVKPNAQDSPELDMSKYLIKKGKEYSLTAPYKQYELSNYVLTN